MRRKTVHQFRPNSARRRAVPVRIEVDATNAIAVTLLSMDGARQALKRGLEREASRRWPSRAARR